jgi:hypothetical protein
VLRQRWTERRRLIARAGHAMPRGVTASSVPTPRTLLPPSTRRATRLNRTRLLPRSVPSSGNFSHFNYEATQLRCCRTSEMSGLITT